MENNKIISVIIPCYNAEKTIGRCLTSVIQSTYPINLIEIIVVDGKSVDATSKIVKDFSEKIDIKIIKNERRFQNFGFNLGVDNSKGEIIMRLDAHSSINSKFLSSSVNFLNQNMDSMAVGCLIETKPQNVKSLIGHGISIVMSSIFGVGGSKFRTLNETEKNEFIIVDTAPFCC